jgi:putative MATE family efflux protein
MMGTENNNKTADVGLNADASIRKGRENPYLTGSVPKMFVKTAAPLTFMMMVNGLFTVVDAFFLGVFVGADALTAVTLMFPIFMIMVSLHNLLGNGMASVVARQFGAGKILRANKTLISAHMLSLVISAGIIGLFLLFGNAAIDLAANGDAALADMGYIYIAPMIFCAPLAFALSLQSDALRSEGKANLMAMIGVAVTLLNIVFNYILIVMLEMGVLGSALGTILAQLLAALIIVMIRLRGMTELKLFAPMRKPIYRGWGEIMALGIPPSLAFMGVSIISGIAIISLQTFAGDSYQATVAAYGVITRITAFTFLPLLGLSMATQSMVGNNEGAGVLSRVDATLKTGMLVAFTYCLTVELIMVFGAEGLGSIFVDDQAVIAEVGRILPIVVLPMFTFGPIFILTGYFQALGDAKKAAILGLAKPYVFAIPLILSLPHVMGEWGIWVSGVFADALMVIVAFVLLVMTAKSTGARYGLFRG